MILNNLPAYGVVPEFYAQIRDPSDTRWGLLVYPWICGLQVPGYLNLERHKILKRRS